MSNISKRTPKPRKPAATPRALPAKRLDPQALAARGPRQVARDETRAAILLVAREELTKRGFTRASVREIARRANVATGTLALHFGDKLGLVQAMLHADLEDVLKDAFATAPKKPLAAQLSHIAKRVFSYYQENAELSGILLQSSLLCEEPWRARFVLQAGFAHARLSELVVQAMDRKELPADVDESLVALSFLSFHYFALISWAQRAIEDPVALVDRLMAAHLTALKKEKK